MDNSDASRSLTDRDNKGRFTSGPGNPGRPVGAKSKIIKGALSDLRAMTPDAIDVVRTAIDKGDVKTATWLLERVLPAQRVVELDGAGVEDIINALTAGEISPTEAKTIAHSIGHLKNISDLDELRSEVEGLTRLLRGDEQ